MVRSEHHLQAASAQVKPQKCPVNEASRVWSGCAGEGRHVVTLSRGLVKWQQRGAGRQVPPSDIVCGLAVGQNSSLPLPPLRPSPTPPPRPETKLGPSQTLHALVLSLLYFPPLLYHLGHSVHFGFLRLFLLTSSVLERLLFKCCFFSFASFNKALVRNPHTAVPLLFPYKHAHNPTQHVNFPHPRPPPPLLSVVCMSVILSPCVGSTSNQLPNQ